MPVWRIGECVIDRAKNEIIHHVAYLMFGVADLLESAYEGALTVGF